MTAAFESRGTKPYECDACHEHRDAHESPPTEVDGELVCEDCEPEQDVPLREIPSLILDLRGRLAQAQTDRDRFQRERAEALAALAISRQTVDDLTAHSVSQGDYIARLQLDVETFQHTSEYWRERSQQNFARADKLAEWVAQQAIDCDYTAEDMRELIEAAGVECRECDGRGVIDDEVMLGDPGDKHGYTTRAVRDECDACHGIGRVIR